MTYQYENWMLLYQNQSIKDIIIPGSHDSFASSFKSFSHNDLNLPIIFNPIIKLWAKTQNKTITEQLYNGIRYFDIRIEEYKNTYYTVHSLLSQKLDNILNEIINFISLYPTEKIILDINHTYNITNNNNFINYLLTKLNNYLIINDINNLSKPLNELNNNIFLFYGNHYNNNKIFPNYYINSIWHNTNNINILCNNITNETLQNNKLNVSQMILTIDNSDIIKSILCPLCNNNSLYQLNQSHYNEMMETLNNVGIHKNIIIMDFITKDFINLCLELNNSKFNIM